LKGNRIPAIDPSPAANPLSSMFFEMAAPAGPNAAPSVASGSPDVANPLAAITPLIPSPAAMLDNVSDTLMS